MKDRGPHCPNCHEALDGYTSLKEDGEPALTPEPTDVCLCFYCHTTLIVTPDYTFRPITAEEFLDLPLELRSLLHNTVRVLGEFKRRQQR